LIIADGGTIGQAAGPLLTFDDSGNTLKIDGCYVGIGVSPSYVFQIKGITNPIVHIDGEGNNIIGVTIDGASGIAVTRYDNSVAVRGASMVLASMVLQRARGSQNSPAIIQNNDRAGYFDARGYTGASYRPVGKVVFEVDGVPSESSMPGRIAFKTQSAGEILYSPPTKWTIDNVGHLKSGTDGEGIYDIRTSGSVLILSDSSRLKLGDDEDASIYYDGTNLVIDPKESGSGYLEVLGDIKTISNISGGKFFIGVGGSIDYDGTDLIINPKESGSGSLNILGDVEIPSGGLTLTGNILMSTDSYIYTVVGVDLVKLILTQYGPMITTPWSSTSVRIGTTVGTGTRYAGFVLDAQEGDFSGGNYWVFNNKNVSGTSTFEIAYGVAEKFKLDTAGHLTLNGTIEAAGAEFGDGTNGIEISGTGDTVFTGTGGLVFGSCSGYHIGWSQVAAQNVWYNIVDANIIDGQLNDVTHDGNGKLTVGKMGKYLCNAVVDWECSVVNKHIELGFEVNGSGSAETEGIICSETKFANEEHVSSITAILDLSENATIELCVRTTDAGNPTIRVDCISLNCVQIGGT